MLDRTLPAHAAEFRLGPAINRDRTGGNVRLVWLFTVCQWLRGASCPIDLTSSAGRRRDCLQLARVTSDPRTRASLPLMAQKWFDLADGSPGQGRLDAAIGEFNARQMEPKPAVRQHQQIQPKRANKEK
jgi:hypothetical protein